MWSLLLSLTARADPCADTMDWLQRGVPDGSVARLAHTLSFDEAALACLHAAGAPRRVALAAARGSGLAAPAAPPARWELGAELGWFVAHRSAIVRGGGLGLRAAWLPTERVGVEASAALLPPGRDHARPLSAQVALPSPTDALLGIRSRSALDLVLAPIAGQLWLPSAAWDLRGSLSVGAAAVATLDDPHGIMGLTDDPSFLATARQTHPALHWGATLRLDPPTGPRLRLALDQSRWVEVMHGIELEHRQLTLGTIGAAALLR